MNNYSNKQDFDSAMVSRDVTTVEVVEGNDESVWAMWEDSVAFQDSQFTDSQPAPLLASKTPTQPAPLDADSIDAFASVHKNSA